MLPWMQPHGYSLGVVPSLSLRILCVLFLLSHSPLLIYISLRILCVLLLVTLLPLSLTYTHIVHIYSIAQNHLLILYNCNNQRNEWFRQLTNNVNTSKFSKAI